MKSNSSSRSGVALVIVLGFLVIVSALAVAFFTSVNTELKGARTFASGVSTRQLADSAANLVMSQIRDATARDNGAWASQPGLIRVFRDASGPTPQASSRAEAFFKLYSSDKMVVKGQADLKSFVGNPDQDYEPQFAQHPAFWTDLNAPVVVADPVTGVMTPHFPIIDPQAKGVVHGFDFDAGKVNGALSNGGPQDRLPMPVRWIYVLQDGTFTVPDQGTKGVAKWSSRTDGTMPTKTNPIVGRIAFWADDDCSKVNINTAAGFVNTAGEVPPGYTGEDYFGSYWDTPRFYTNFDYGVPYPDSHAKAGMPVDGQASGGLALTQLLQGEYQRYPGHPATTSLGGIFGTYMNSHDLWRILPRTSTANYLQSTSYNSYSVDGFSYGTDGGTKRVVVGAAPGGTRADNQNMLPKTQRLYASVDELLFNTDPGGSNDAKSPTYMRRTNDSILEAGPARLTPERLDRLRFFLTASSRAPELNLFGRPRVSVWSVRSERNDETVDFTNAARPAKITQNRPTGSNIKYFSTASPTYSPDGGTGLNPYDKMMLFCCTIGTQVSSTIAGVRTSEFGSTTSKYEPGMATGTTPGPLPYRYIFTRRNAHIGRDMDPSPGSFPVTLLQEDRNADVTLPRNRFLLETYLSTLTSLPIPGFADPNKPFKSLKAKLDSDGNRNRDALLVEIFDYVRCANMQDGTTLKFINTTDTSGDKNREFAPRGLMAPSKIEFQNHAAPYNSSAYVNEGRSPVQTSSGMGRFPTICEATLVFYYAGPTYKLQKFRDTSVSPAKVWGEGGLPKIPLPEVFSHDEAVAQSVTAMEGVPKWRQMRAFLLFSTFNPMFGYAPLSNPGSGEHKLQIEVEGLEQLKVDYAGQTTVSLGFPSAAPDGNPLATTVYITSGGHWAGRNMGGYEGFMHTLIGPQSFAKVWPQSGAVRGTNPLAKCRKTFNKELEAAFFGRGEQAYGIQVSTANGARGNWTGNLPKQEYYPFQTSLMTSNPIEAAQGKGVPGYNAPGNPNNFYADPDEHPDGTGLLVPTWRGGAQVSTFNFHGNEGLQPIKVKLYYDNYTHYDSTAVGASRNTRPATARAQPVQELHLYFKDGNGWPVPKGDAEYDGSSFAGTQYKLSDDKAADGANPWARANFHPAPYPGVTLGNQNLWMYYWQFLGSFYPQPEIRSTSGGPTDLGQTWYYEFFGKGPYSNTVYPKPLDLASPRMPGGTTNPALTAGPVLKCGLEPAWSFASRALWSAKNSEGTDRPLGPGGTPESPYGWYSNRFLNIVQPGDTVRSLMYWTPPTGSTTLAANNSGDLRIVFAQSISDGLKPHPDYESNVQRACGLRTGSGTRYFSESTLVNRRPALDPALASGISWFGNLVEPDIEKPAGNYSGKFLQQDRAPANLPVSFPLGTNTGTRGQRGGVMSIIRKDPGNKIGDFDTGMGNFADGPYGNKPDEGNVVFAWFNQIERKWYYPIPYFTYTWAYEEPGDTFTSPMRQMPSPGMIGSLPRRPMSGNHWETVCLTPYPAGDNHPGNDYPKDHLLLDLFSMPVVEPYPITEPFSTAGKINMNYRIVPFNYITRSTALRAAMAPIRVTGVPQNDYRSYKVGEVNSNGNAKDPQVRLTDNYRKLLDANKPINSPSDLTTVSRTLQGFEDYFDQAKNQADPDLGIFKSASQICEMPLWPLGESSITDFWNRSKLTGDNVREKPYTDLYPRLTTKSNTYTVHFRVQTLRQIPRNTTSSADAYAIWEEGKDNVLGEYRGATTVERYIDPTDTRLNKWDSTGAANKDFINPDLTSFDPSQNPASASSPLNPSRSLELIYRFRTVLNKKFAP